MRIESDPAKSAANLKKHGVPFEEAATALLDTLARTLEEGGIHGEVRYITLGVSECSRLLVVVWTERGEKIRLISARQATRNERVDYET
ncbi:MAG: BrnT family toxin [Nitrosomonadales bacterium]|nr:BrnT family toxin [Nitrosomonadales bacterium]